MNANELADDSKNISNTIEALEWVQKAVPMLRQQADKLNKYELRHAEQRKRIEELEKGLIPDLTPLYAHPAELTDFEIMQISAGYPDRLYFAKALLRKAQEK